MKSSWQNQSALGFNRLAAPMFVLTGLVACGAVGLSVSRCIEALSGAAVPALQETSKQNAATAGPPDAQAIAQLGWFGLAPEDTAAAPGMSGAGDLASRYELRGISAAGQNETFSGAFIAEQGQPEIYYRIGDALPGHDGTLAGVFTDHVTIKQGQKPVDLNFPGAPPGEPAVPPDASSGASPYFYLPADQPGPPNPSPGDLAKQFIADPEKLLVQAGLKPVALGQNKGYLFNGEDSQGVFEGTLLQKGDVILSVNGAAVGDMKGNRLLLPKLMTAQSLDLQVRRGDQTITLPYKMP